jgi:hypothetical protein
MDDLAARLRDAGAALLELRGALVAGEPWPLSAIWGTEPEADWGPRELLAHVDEMLPYWTAQLGAIVAGDPGVAVPFGRIATDPARLARIEADRQRSTADLLDGIATGLEPAASFVAGLSTADSERRALHPIRGEMTVRGALELFLVSHLEEHLAQLRGILARRRTA